MKNVTMVSKKNTNCTLNKGTKKGNQPLQESRQHHGFIKLPKSVAYPVLSCVENCN